MSLDLQAYLRRIGIATAGAPSPSVLAQLHDAHTRAIPFENLDVLLGRNIRLDVAALQQKLVHENRGGYCFEQNSLFAAVLRELGYSVTTLGARVRYSVPKGIETPMTHMVLAVESGDRTWLADVGFGGVGLTTPIPWEVDVEQVTRLDTYRLAASGGNTLLQANMRGEWQDLYEIGPEPLKPIDYEVANWFTSTHPSSRFVQGLAVARPTEDGRWTLRNGVLAFRRGDDSEESPIRTMPALIEVLRLRFGLAVPLDARFRVPVLPAPTDSL